MMASSSAMTMVVTDKLYDEVPYSRSTGLREAIEQFVLFVFKSGDRMLQVFEMSRNRQIVLPRIAVVGKGAGGFRHDCPQLIIGRFVPQHFGLLTADSQLFLQFPHAGRAPRQPVTYQTLLDTSR